MKSSIFTALIFFLVYSLHSQVENETTELHQISETLILYIDGTANGEPEKLKRAFHPDFNLYSVTQEDSLRIWKGKDYVSNVKEGKKSNRIGKIVSIDCENNVGTARVEIEIPNKGVFIDYFLLLKYKGSWKIVHKSYTWKPYKNPKDN